MKKTHLSLYYLIGYLIPSGLLLGLYFYSRDLFFICFWFISVSARRSRYRPAVECPRQFRQE